MVIVGTRGCTCKDGEALFIPDGALVSSHFVERPAPLALWFFVLVKRRGNGEILSVRPEEDPVPDQEGHGRCSE